MTKQNEKKIEKIFKKSENEVIITYANEKKVCKIYYSEEFLDRIDCYFDTTGLKEISKEEYISMFLKFTTKTLF